MSEKGRSTDECWVRGDLFGLDIPADFKSLSRLAADFLTTLFRASGALSDANRVTAITQCEECLGGGTGSKALLAVTYATPDAALPTCLFVKFSRNFHDEIRDRSKYMMISEIRFAALSRARGFPIAVPQCLFADIHEASGTGLIITERIAFAANGVEPQYVKCLDYAVPQPLPHYEAIIRTLARLSGRHKAGGLDAAFDAQFPFDLSSALNADPLRHGGEKLQRRAARVVDLIARYPQLFPANLAGADFHAQFLRDVPRLEKNFAAVKRFLYSNPDLIALCHWNANIDNGWFWRDAQGVLQCGLMDWGRVGQMTVAQTIYGAFSGAETPLWDVHLDGILRLFIVEYAHQGGPMLDFEELKLHTLLVTATMGLAYLMDAPAIIERQIPDLAGVRDHRDELIRNNEDARVQLHMLTMFLNQWQTRNFGALIDGVVRSL
jgi:hypothetical protein